MVSDVLQVLPSFGNSSSIPSSEGISASSSISDIRQINNLPFYLRAFKEILNEAKIGETARISGEVTNFSFLGGTLLEKFINNNFTPETIKTINDIDKSLLASKASRNVIEDLFDCKFQINSSGKLVLTASKEAIKAQPFKLAAGKVAADVLGVTTKFGLLTSGLTEAPDLIAAGKNGDFGKQTVRSTAKTLVSTVAFGTILHFAKELAPAPVKTLAMFGCTIAGSIAATKATDKFLDKVMGKSIKVQKKEAEKYLAEMQQQRTLMMSLS